MPSKYTAMLRNICEQKAGLLQSEEYPEVKQIIRAARQKIFDFDYPIYDENYRSVLETNILRHYYMQEIGYETYAAWKLALEAKMNEIMPKYNAMYEALNLDINPLYNKDIWTTYAEKGHDEQETSESGTGTSLQTNDLTTKHDSERTDNLTETTNSNGTENYTTTDENTRTDNLHETAESSRNANTIRDYDHVDKYSDTPQGSIQDIDLKENAYLTNARIVHDDEETDVTESANSTRDNTGTVKNSGSGSNTGTTTSEGSRKNSGTQTFADSDTNTGTVQHDSSNSKTGNRTADNNKDYVMHVAGYDTAPFDNIQKWIAMERNIDFLIIKELKCLFMGLWY